MAKIYENQKSHVTTVSGQIVSVDADRMGMQVKSSKWNAGEKKMEDQVVNVKSAVQLEADVAVGNNVTFCGFFNPVMKAYQAMNIMIKSGCFEMNELAVVRGEVVKAEMNEEKNADGSNKLKADGKPRKPHYDIKITTTEPNPASDKGETMRVLHTIRVYAMTGKDGNVNTANLDRVKKIFNNYNRSENPATVTVVTSPAPSETRENEYNGKVYTNTYVNHMGFKSIDVEWGKERTQEKSNTAAEEKKEEEPAPAPVVEEKKEPVQAGSGFEADNSYEAQEIEADPETMFI